MTNSGGYFKLATIPQKIVGILSVTKLNQIFKEFNNIDEELASFN